MLKGVRSNNMSAERDINPETVSNPWLQTSSYFNVGTMKNILSLAERMGQKEKQTDNETSMLQSTIEKKCSSVKLIKILREITRLGQEIDKVNLQLEYLLQEIDTKDITQTKILEKRISDVTEISLYLTTIIEKKDELVSRLQTPFAGEYLMVDAAYHIDTEAAVPAIGKCLASLPNDTETLDHGSKMSLKDGQLGKVLSTLGSEMVLLQNYFKTLCETRRAMSQLYESRGKNQEEL